MRNPMLLHTLIGISFIPVVGMAAASLQGRVTTVEGSPLAGVRVEVFTKDGSAVGGVSTNDSGAWAIEMPAGRYELRFAAPGFAMQTRQNVASPGTVSNITLDSETGADTARTVTYRPVVDPDRTQQADFIQVRQLMELPVNRRNYLDLALLTPGVTSSDRATNASTGLQPANDPQSGLSISGNDGRGNIFWLDGGENYINTGGVRTSISQEAVAEFQISRNSFSAEFGGGIGGIVNIVSKSGTELFHGDVFGFIRQRSMLARNFFDPGHAPFTRVQSGVTLGGPLQKEKTHFFAAFENLDRHESALVSIFRNPSELSGLTPSQQKLIPYLGVFAPALRQALDTRNFPSTIALLSRNNGVFPLTEENSTGSIRVDHNLSDNDQIFFRLNATGESSSNTNLQSLTGSSQGDRSSLRDVTLLANNNAVLTARLVSETRLSANYYDSYAHSADPYGPDIRIAGVAALGRGAFLPTKLREWHGQLQQNFFYTPGRHSVRFGIEVNPVRNSPSVAFRQGGQFVFAKFLPLGGLLNQLSGNPNASAQLAQTLAANGQAGLVSTLSDPITALQSFNLGIPAVYVQSVGNDSFVRWTKRYNSFVNDVYRVTPSLTLNLGLRYELELNDGLPNSYSNVAPRLGFAWAATRDRKTVVRGGYGIFYQRNNLETLSAAALFPENQLSLLTVPVTGIPGFRNPLTGGLLSSADIYQTLLAEGVLGNRSITARDLAQFGIVPGSNPYPIRVSIDPHWRRPYSEQASFEVERALGGIAVSAALNFNRALHLPRTRDTNVVYGPRAADGSPTYLPINPTVAINNIFEPRGNSYYTALILQAAKRFSERVTLDAHYTLSRVTDDASVITDLPNNSLNVRDDRALASFHQKHRFVASAVLAPHVAGSYGFARALNGFLFAPIIVAASGLPFNVETGLQDGQRPFGTGRNTGQGPGYASFDTRLSRSFALHAEGLRLELIAEGFNILNRTNFAQLNNVVGNVTRDQLPAKLVGTPGNPLTPFSFTSANPPRQIQLALKLRW